MDEPRVVVIATTIGYDGVPHAGGTYLKALSDLMAPLTDLTVMVPGSRTNRDAAARPGAPSNLIPLGLEPATSVWGRMANRLSLNADTRLRRRDPGMPYIPLMVGIARSAEVRQVLGRADVIDLQWSDSVRLVHLLRRINPRARIVGTFHDVMSQSFARKPHSTAAERRHWHGVARRSRRHERRMVRALDEVLVFSAKDADLLGSPKNARVVRPPLWDGALVRHEPGKRGSVLFVSYLARHENNEAAVWVVEHVWPLVIEQVPDARLRLVGGGASAELREMVRGATGVELTGFVDDLMSEYAAAATALVPLRRGAGVKFKTIEALLSGVPTITTSVGAEGVGPHNLFTSVADDAPTLSSAIVRVLQDPGAVQPQADAAQEWAWSEFSKRRFIEAILQAWGVSK